MIIVEAEFDNTENNVDNPFNPPKKKRKIGEMVREV